MMDNRSDLKPASGLFITERPDWLARLREDIIDPDRPIIDPHHHLWDRRENRYLIDQLLEDIDTGHNIVGTVYVECRSMYRADGPEELRSAGEVEFVNGIGAMSRSGGYGRTRLCEGIVAFANLLSGSAVPSVLQALVDAGQGRLRGIRQSSAWDMDPSFSQRFEWRPKNLLGNDRFREGFACLAPLGLSYDAYMFHHQIPELTSLAQVFEDTAIVIDHLGGPIGVGAYAGRRDEVFNQWRTAMRDLARCPNVFIKLGGLGMSVTGFGFHENPDPPGSESLADAWRPYFQEAIDLFGPDRSMFESNFPPDKGTASYAVLWNSFKRLSEGYSDSEKHSLFFETANRFYKLKMLHS